MEAEKEEPEVCCVSVACQTELESEETEVSGASWGFPQLKAQLEEVMASLNNSSGYGTDLSSALDDEENCDDTSSESGVESLTSSPCEGHTKSEKFEQKKQRGFKRGSGRSSHHSRVARREDQGLRDRGA